MTNIEKLARLIVSTGHADQIMSILSLTLPRCKTSPSSTASAQKGGENV